MSHIDEYSDRTRQSEEVAALSSIYEGDWCEIDEDESVYGVVVRHGDRTLNLQVRFPADYPSGSPPFYEISAPWLRGEDRLQMCEKLENIYVIIKRVCRENLGESVVYLWVESVRESLVALAERAIPRESSLFSAIQHFEEIFEVDHTEYDDAIANDVIECECPQIMHSEPFTKRASTFQAHVATLVHKTQVKMVLDKLKENKKIANATHNIMAYRITNTETSTVIQGCDDDGETHAGSRLLHLLQIVGGDNVMVVVTRWFGGILLGPERFKLINNCARDLLVQCGYVTDKEHKKGPKSRLK